MPCMFWPLPPSQLFSARLPLPSSPSVRSRSSPSPPPAHRAFAHIAPSSQNAPLSSLHLANSSSSFSCQLKHLIFRESFSSLSNQVTAACHRLPRLLCSFCHDANFTFMCVIMLWNLTLRSINSVRTGAVVLCAPRCTPVLSAGPGPWCTSSRYCLPNECVNRSLWSAEHCHCVFWLWKLTSSPHYMATKAPDEPDITDNWAYEYMWNIQSNSQSAFHALSPRCKSTILSGVHLIITDIARSVR